MRIANNIRRDIRAAKKIRLPGWAQVCLFFGSLPTYWLFDHFGRFDIALPTVVIIFVLCFVIGVKWELRRHAWFWGTIVVLAALHVPLILFLPWTTKWVPATVTAAIGSVDLIVMLAIIDVVAKVVERPSAADG